MSDDELARAIERLADLGHLSAGISHHVINAFAAVVSNAEILRLTSELPGSVDPIAVADTIVKTAVDASAVARRLIDYSRSATAIGDDLVRLDRLVDRFVEKERAGSHPGVTWDTKLQPLPPIRGHEVQLRAMLRHLVANAYEAMPGSTGTIEVSTSLDQRGWAVLEIRDSGAGMDPATLERAIEPFFTTKPGRPGVGLSIANGIWRRHRGTLALRSQPGEGTLVRLCVDPSTAGQSPPRP
jgi:signal transduction histidine kinase